MPKDSYFYVNGMDETLDESLQKMKGYNRRYLRDMGTVLDAERGLLSRESLDKYAPKELKAMVMQRIKQNKLTDPSHGGKLPIMCKDGKLRYYRPDAWSETIARTRSRALQEEGLHNQMVRSGFDLVQVSIGGSGDPCTNWEGSILSITGETPGYPTVDDAQASGEIFHPNCVHSSSPLIITEDENGPKIWGRDDLTPKAQEQLKNAGVTRKGTIRNGLNVALSAKSKSPVNMMSTNLAKTTDQAIKKASGLADQVYFSKTMNINGLNEATFAIDESIKRFPAGNKFFYIGLKDKVTTLVGKQYKFQMGKNTSAMFVRYSDGTNMIVFRNDAVNDVYMRNVYKQSAIKLQNRYGEFKYDTLLAQGMDKRVIYILEKQKMRHWAISGELGGTKGIMYHEYGHKVLHTHTKRSELKAILNTSYSKGWSLPLGQYAQTSVSEYFSEAFSAYMQGLGHLLDPDVLKWLKNNDLGG